MESTQTKHKDVPEEGLTCIHPRIHCAATQDGTEEHTETDTIMVNAFIETLAEVAMAVANRRLAKDRGVD